MTKAPFDKYNEVTKQLCHGARSLMVKRRSVAADTRVQFPSSTPLKKAFALFPIMLYTYTKVVGMIRGG
jgi:hypothetical protein